MRTMTQSVGRGGSNLPQDVSTVQFLLNRVSRDEGGPKVRIKQDGNPSEKLNKDIQIFQLHHFGWSGADGRVDPGHQTIRKLNELNSEPLTTKRFLLTQLSPNKSLRTQRTVDWFYEVLPLDGNPDLQKTLFWLGTTQRNHVTIPRRPSRYENTILTSSIPIQVSDLVGRASFVTFALAG